MPRLDPILDDPQTDAPRRLGPTDAGRVVSAEMFAHACFEPPYLYERTAGRLRVMSPDGWEHVNTSEPWRDRLGAYALARPDLIRRVASQAWVRIRADSDRVADIGVYLVGGDSGAQIPNLVPDLIFEVVSRSREDRERDYIAKRAEYEAIGVREYVIIDRFDRRVTVLTLGGGRYAERVIPAGGRYESSLLPGLVIPLDEVGL